MSKDFISQFSFENQYKQGGFCFMRKGIVFLLVICMLISLTACKKGADTSEGDSSSNVTSVESNDVITEDSSNVTPDKDGETTSDSSNEPSSSTNSSSKPSTTTSAVQKTENELTNYYQKFDIKGTTVKMLLWYTPDKEEQEKLDAFEKMTGATVKVVKTTYGNYQTKVAATIAAGSPVDCVMLGVDFYPSFLVRKLMQPIDSYIDKKDPTLDFSAMNTMKWDNKYYGITSSKEADFQVIFFNKTMFDNTPGVSNPLELYNAGKWNWNTFADLCKKMTVKEGGVTKKYGFTQAQQKTFMQSSGASFFKIENGTKVKVNLKESNVAVG